MNSWLVVGGSGFLGSALVGRLVDEHILVATLAAPRLHLDPETDAGELINAARTCLELDALAERMRGYSVVVNAAGVAMSGASETPELFGANALLPVVIAIAAARAKVPRILHLSSAAVQGRTQCLDAAQRVAPFSPYSESKALAEQALWQLQDELSGSRRDSEITIIRATSVQGSGRATTSMLERIARSPLASVATPGDQPTPVTTVRGLLDEIVRAGIHESSLPPIILQPSEGETVTSVLYGISGRSPRRLPRNVCLAVLKTVWPLCRMAGPRWVARARQLEMMWLGQEQSDTP